MTGETFRRLLVTGYAGMVNGRCAWTCCCSCGAEVTVIGESLCGGNTRSCGCLRVDTARSVRTRHGEVRRVNGKRVASPEYRAWQLMKNRCLNPDSRDYRYYGARGIKIHPEWADSFEAFLRDVGRRPSKDYTLDRIDVDGGYEPSNVRWATRLVQARNRRYSTTKAWLLAERLGVRQMTAHHMIWQVRAKDKGNMKWFALSPELESVVRDFLEEIA